jgi:16S rRNA (guanine1207-N2)-methyltransferase
MVRGVNLALETLMLPFASGEVAAPSAALFLGAEAHPDLKGWPMLTGWQPLKPLADAWEKAGFARVEHAHGVWPMVLALPGKSKEETLALFAKAYDLLAPGGTLVVAMANTAGAGRFEKELGAVAGEVATFSKNKCRVFRVVKTEGWKAATLEEWRALGRPRKIVGDGGEWVTEAGIFSPEHVDPGSAFLMEHLPKGMKGVAADLGAGWGYLSRRLAAESPELKSVHLFEADARALECARVNLHGAGVETFFHWHDVATGLPGKYEVVVINPPFHTGQAINISLGCRFLRSAVDALRIGGRMFIVANRQLPYEAELDRLGVVWRKVAENPTYKLLFADKRR